MRLLERIFVKLFDDVGWLKAELEDFEIGFLKAVRRTIKIPDNFLWFPVISVRKSVVVRNYCRGTYRFVEKAPRGKVFQLQSALLLNVSNVSSKKKKLLQAILNCVQGQWLVPQSILALFSCKRLQNWTSGHMKATLSTPVLFFLTWIRLLPDQNINENRILGSLGWKVPGEDGTSQKMTWFQIGILLRKFLFLFFLQDFFNLSLLPDSVFCGHFLVAGTDFCKLKVDKNPERNLPVPSFAYHLAWTTVITVFYSLLHSRF